MVGASEAVIYPGGLTKNYPRKEIMKKIFSGYRFLDVFSIAIKFFFTVYLPYLLGFTILIEEGPIMTLHTYMVVFPDSFDSKPKMPPCIQALVNWIMTKSHVSVILTAKDEELVVRRKKRTYRRNELQDYIFSQKKWIAKQDSGNIIFIDTTGKSIKEVSSQISICLKKL